MNTEMHHETHNDVRIQGNRIQIFGPVFMLFSGLFALVALFVFGVFAATHFTSLVSMSGIVVVGVLIFIGLLAFVLVAKLLIQHVFHPIVNIRGEVHRHKILHTAETYAIVLERGEARVIPVSQEKYNYSIRQVAEPPHAEPKLLEAPKTVVSQEQEPELTIPDLVRYDDIRASIPQGHALVGVSERGIETKKKEVRALIWIVGGSGVGKTNSVCIRIDDDYHDGYHFLGVDPHAFKEDSLTNALKNTPYTKRFLIPMAQDIEAINAVLQAFLDEFKRRKDGVIQPPYHPITLVVDEVGSMVLDVDQENETEVKVARKLKEIARICGQESRGFRMYGIYISQDAAGLAWLRKRALMVLGHQVLMMSERLLVCNQNRDIANEMETWPVGRTVVYGIAFPEGQRVVQQPIFTPARVVEADKTYIPPLEDLRRKPFPPSNPMGNTGNVSGNTRETALEVDTEGEIVRIVSASSDEHEISVKQKHSSIGNETRETIRRMVMKGMPLREIATLVGLSGRKYVQFQEVCRDLGIVQVESEAQ